MKKSVSLLIAVSILATIFSGCVFSKTSPEENIINMHVAGYLYTSQTRADSKAERGFLKEREKTITTMIESVEKTAGFAFKVTDGLEKYEDNLLKYIEKIEISSFNFHAISKIIEKIIAYKVILESIEEELRQYMKMKPDRAVESALINTFLLDSMCQLVESQKEYICWLINNTASVSSLLENTSEKQAKNLVSSASAVFGRQIEENLQKMLGEYEAVALINSAVISVDYYASTIYLDNIAAYIEQIKSGKTKGDVSIKDLTALEESYNYVKVNLKAPTDLKPIPPMGVSFSLFGRVSAAEEKPPGFELFDSMLGFLVNVHQLDAVKEFGARISKEKVTEEILMTKEEIEKAGGELIEKILEVASEKPAYNTENSNDVNNTVNTAAQSAADKANMISNISRAQYATIGTQKIFGTDKAYAAVIDKIAELLAEASSADDKKAEAAYEFIKNGMEELIGENKEEFVNFILTTIAEDLYETFMTWIVNIYNAENHEFTKNDFYDLLISMDIGFNIEASDNDEPSSEIRTNTESPSVENPSSDQPVATSSPNPDSTPVPSAPVYSPEVLPEITPYPGNPTDYDVFHIMAPYQIFKNLNIYSDNAYLLYIIYGWVDHLDYSSYQKLETVKMDNSLDSVFYVDKDEENVGWSYRIGDGTLTYNYHFPGEKGKTLEIMRNGNLEKSYVTIIKSEDESIDRLTLIHFHKPNQEDVFESVDGISEKQDGNKDGLNFTGSTFNYTYERRNKGRLIDSYQFNYGILVKEIHNEYSGDDKYSNIKNYFQSGNLMSIENTLNNNPEGIYKIYYENKYMQSIFEFKDGKKEGTEKRYFISGKLNVLETYVNGEKNGPYEKYYDNDNHQLRTKGTYTKNIQSGVWYVYNEDGSLQNKTEY